ncbi:MAG: phosphoglycerate kinase [Candidatus Zambryskibacteria bacterium RIFCSPHIGHO2_01_FULL_43_25]|uniref:Phosphoglycerate kinase n=1 Tax=Candidatus Zambryskibacteria bacterium RIFCSPLOWO2_01_FULL_45_21 TaxID=1802761 RepID=A0A1G2U4J2_9BACT|nr:MAG: phosphoglycerate kinase [Candidatus Zambryskibacteria bacterium RIFCSPHIGHO2_01_FULL_43_25]OHB00807.1 MAG: phosphoglycerate kinase [Candidatus Zambryskibacteria bacterium RIFCSPHIGHO2_12_FULL_44_12b]OHB04401.1 MAG: phosphoglycerate kinase [Candidatus Zambryskibacteria bacterium RIFCSPLOWO2_01_FULL_45_21]
MKTVDSIPDVSGKKIFLRLDLNVPVSGGRIVDDFRIKRALPTVAFLKSRGAQLIIASHFEGENKTLGPVFEYFKNIYPEMAFVNDYFPNNIGEAGSSGIVFLENLRKYPEEKLNDENFARHLASFAEVYVNEAFPVSHRRHASIISLPKFLPKFCGFAFAQEVEKLSYAFTPDKPFLFILGGAKFETKLPLIKKFSSLADSVFIGGALANDLLKARGNSVGKSLVSDIKADLSEIPEGKLIVPVDVVVKSENGEVSVKPVNEIAEDESVVDSGPKTIEILGQKIKEARFILWNGPLGNYEFGFKKGTEDLAKLIAQAPAHSIVGGGDTIASIAELDIGDKFSFLSSGGGAMLEFLATGTLPGIEALE